MDNSNSLLLSQMNPEQARLLDQQLRNKQIQQQAQGAGLFSGAVQAGLMGANTIRGAFGGMPEGVNETAAKARAAKEKEKKTKMEALQKKITGASDEDLMRLSRGVIASDPAAAKLIRDELSFRRQTKQFGTAAEINELELKNLRSKMKEQEESKERNEELSEATDNIMGRIDLSPTKKLFIDSLPSPQDKLKYLTEIEQTKREEERKMQITSQVRSLVDDVNNLGSSTEINNSYLNAIDLAERTGLPEVANSLRKERKAIVDQKQSVEDVEQSIKEDWESDKSVQETQGAISIAKRGRALLSQEQGVSNLAVLVQFFKAIDPESVVKETELEMLNNVTSTIESIKTTLNQLIEGKAAMSPSLKKELSDFFVLMGDLSTNKYNSMLEEQKERYKGRGYDVDFMFGDVEDNNFSSLRNPEKFTFDLTGQNKVAPEIQEGLESSFNAEFSASTIPEQDNNTKRKAGLRGLYKQHKDNPEALRQLQEQVKQEYGFDALGYLLYKEGVL